MILRIAYFVIFVLTLHFNFNMLFYKNINAKNYITLRTLVNMAGQVVN